MIRVTQRTHAPEKNCSKKRGKDSFVSLFAAADKETLCTACVDRSSRKQPKKEENTLVRRCPPDGCAGARHQKSLCGLGLGLDMPAVGPLLRVRSMTGLLWHSPVTLKNEVVALEKEHSTVGGVRV